MTTLECGHLNNLDMEGQILDILINNNPQFVFWKDRSSVYLGCNNNFSKSAGYQSPSEVIGRTDYDMPWSREEADFFRRIDQEVMSTGKPRLNFEETQTLKDKSIRWLSTSKVPLHDQDENIVGILGWYVDITDYKQMKIQIDEKNKALLDYNLQLTKSKNELEQANSDLERFTYAVSHDLKTPIRNMVSYAQLIDRTQKTNPGKSIQEYITTIVDSGKRMYNLVDDILTYARTGTEELVAKEACINQIVSEKLLDLQQYTADGKCKVSLDLPELRIRCYPHLLGVVFYNLISNGLKFNTSARPEVICSHKETEKEWLFCVTDNGIGVDDNYIDEIFKPFKRIEGNGFEGSGLGLSICKRIVRIHKGRIWAEKNASGGSVFIFTISKNLS